MWRTPSAINKSGGYGSPRKRGRHRDIGSVHNIFIYPEIGWRETLRFARLAAMKSAAKNVINPAPPSAAARVDAIDWTQASRDLDAQGCAVLKGLLSAEECRGFAALYPDDKHFRSRVVMGRHGFGRGEYKYFSYPLPDLIAELRSEVYPRLVPIANRWNEAMGLAVRYPEAHA